MMSTLRKMPLAVLGVIGLLALALWNPSVPRRVDELDLIAVLDDSLSIGDPASRDAWSEVTNAALNLAADSRFGLVRFATEPVIEVEPALVSEQSVKSILESRTLPRSAAIDRSSTDIELALRRALRLARSHRRTALLLVTDGYETKGDAAAALRVARQSNVTVYLFKQGVDTKAPDVRIEALDVPPHVRLGERVPLTVAVGGNTEGKVPLLVDVAGRRALETTISLQRDRANRFHLLVTPQTAGDQEVKVVVGVDNDSIPENNRRAALVTVEPPATVLFVTASDAPSAVVSTLVKGGWIVREHHPRDLVSLTNQLRVAKTIILDDIAVGDMPEGAWEALTKSVSGEGTGLIVLGGPRSFSAGNYRHSELEALLPVTAEASVPEEQLAVLFVVDKSGSMDSDQRGAKRFGLALRAVSETARTLSEKDLTGLIWFDAQPRVVLPLRRYENPADEIERAWSTRPTGGTLVLPALTAAVSALSEVAADQRLLVMVTDGFAPSGEDLRPLQQQIARNGIDVITLIVGDNPDIEPFRRLSRINDGVLLRIHKIAELPRIMQKEVEERRNPAILETSVPRQVIPLPFMPAATEWPTLSGYMVTKARPEAFVYLKSDGDDPLLAMGHVGRARVVVLPEGLRSWTREWPQWPLWGKFIGGIVEWTAARSASPFLQATVEDRSGRLEFVVDAVTPSYEWAFADDGKVIVRDPAGLFTETPLVQTAPGHFVGSIGVTQPGRHGASVYVADQKIHISALHTADREFLPDPQSDEAWSALAAEDLVTEWKPGTPISPQFATKSEISFRFPLIVTALLLYLTVLVHERVGDRLWQRRRFP